MVEINPPSRFYGDLSALRNTPLRGRTEAMRSLRALVLADDVRLVTLLGPGGVGKTKLALYLSDTLGHYFSEGSYLVALAGLSKPAGVKDAIRTALGLKESPDQPLAEQLEMRLQGEQLLLVLDNFEHVVGATPLLTELLTNSSGLTVVVTSRTVLRLSNEHVYTVAPLNVPQKLEEPFTPEQLLGYDAAELFVERARAVRPEFTVTADDAPFIAELCRRLDGLPLALELAAAHVKLFSPQTMLARLDNAFDLLRGGPRDRPVRHETLWHAIDWSYQLLDDNEQALLRTLSLFPGSWTLAAAEAVYAAAQLEPPNETTLSLLEALIDKSLVYQTETVQGEKRFALLQTIREYALKKRQPAQQEADNARFSEYYLGLAKAAQPYLVGPEQLYWLEYLEAEHENLRAALEYFSRHELLKMLELANTLAMFWIRRGHLSEARRWFFAALAPGAEHDPGPRALALTYAGRLSILLGDYAQARVLLEQSVALADLAEDRYVLALALNWLGVLEVRQQNYDIAKKAYQKSLSLRQDLAVPEAVSSSLNNLGQLAFEQGQAASAERYYLDALAVNQSANNPSNEAVIRNNLAANSSRQGQFEKAAEQFEKALALRREVGDVYGLATTLINLAEVNLFRNDTCRARAALDEARQINRKLGAKRSMGEDSLCYGSLALAEGEPARAETHFRAALAIGRRLEAKDLVAHSLYSLGYTALQQGNETDAFSLTLEALEAYRHFKSKVGAASCLEVLVELAICQKRDELAAQLHGHAATLSGETSVAFFLRPRRLYDKHVARLRHRLNEGGFKRASQLGATLSLAALLKKLAESEDAAVNSAGGRSGNLAGGVEPLTTREHQVLELVAQGMTNGAVANELGVSPYTVNAHLRTIYSKLGVRNRHSATRFALENGLL